MSSNDELIAQFVEISGSDESVAKFYLSCTNWSLEEALSNFLGTSNDNNYRSENQASTQPITNASTSKVNFEKSHEKAKIATLRDMSERTEDDDDSQAFYAGGSERSGQQVLGPPKKKNFREQLTDMFRMAQEQSSHDESPSSSSSRPSWGQGIRLGMTNTDHSVVSEPKSGDSAEKKPAVILKLWSQGFSIGDGELRLYDDPDNKEFLETVMRGEIPQELLQMGWMVNVDVEDHRHEDFKKPPEKANFKGSGHTLGSPVPSIQCTTSTNLPTNSSELAENEAEAKKTLNIQSDQPTTTLQIRLADGSRMAAQFHLSHTIGDIYQYIMNARPQYSNTFVLVSSFPTRELLDKSMTIEEAKLKNASIMQRLK